MRKPFAELFEIMEARRRQVEVGEVPPSPRLGPSRRVGRRARGCPDAETLCGWVDGRLFRKSPQRWLATWRHIHIRRCRACQEEIEALAPAMGPGAEGKPRELFRLVGFGPTLRRLTGSWRLKSPLAWASCGLVIVVTLSLWSLGNRKPIEIVGEPLEPALMEERRDPTWGRSESATSGVAEQPENTTIWGD